MEKTATVEARVDKQGINSACRKQCRRLLLTDIGWNRLDARETRARLAAFEKDWDAPGMEGYDDL